MRDNVQSNLPELFTDIKVMRQGKTKELRHATVAMHSSKLDPRPNQDIKSTTGNICIRHCRLEGYQC